MHVRGRDRESQREYGVFNDGSPVPKTARDDESIPTRLGAADSQAADAWNGKRRKAVAVITRLGGLTTF